MSQHRGRRLFAVLAIAALATGCGGGSEQLENVAATETPGMGTESPGMTSPGTESPGTATPGGVADVEKVGQAAVKAVPNGTVIKMDADDEGKVWDVTVLDEDGELQLVKIDAQSGKVTAPPTAAQEGDKAEAKQLAEGAKIDYAEAAEKILADTPGGRLTMLELAKEDDKVVWKGEVTDEQGEEREVRVDAQSGEVVPTPGGESPGGESPGGEEPGATPEETMEPEEPGTSPS
jgi:uncharacterized membrane protein YkoI